VRSDEFADFVAPHLASGLVWEWCRGFGDEPDGYPRYAVRGGMNLLAKTVAEPLDVRCGTLVFAIRRGTASAWTVVLDTGETLDADAVVVTCPLPQAYSLLVPAAVELPDALIRTDYDRTLAVLATLDRAPSVPDPGGRQHPTGTLSFVADNQRKGISDAPAITIHANAAWSGAHWDDDRTAVLDELTSAAADFLGAATILEAQLKKWRFATPRTIWPDPCWVAPDGPGPLVLAGDAFAGPRVEGAVLSGLAASQAVLDR
jgi:predicted NAD/FAD-dependent oxidoreductase